MVYEMNIGLLCGPDRGHQTNSWSEIRRRASEIRSYVSDLFPGLKLRLHCGEEPTLVLLFTDEDERRIREIANEICERWNQDCVALRNGLSGEGWLIGPRAHEWGEFNIEYFERY